MLTHFIKSINWVDVALAVLLIRVIFVGVKSGVITELFKFLGVITAVFVSLHYYSYLAAQCAKKVAISPTVLNVVIFVGLWALVVLAFKFIRDGILMLFKVESTHQGFDQYGAGILAVGRGILLCSLTIFMFFLMGNGSLTRMTAHSFSYKIAGRAATKTYAFLYNNLVSKIWAGQQYNNQASEVVSVKVK